MSKEKGPQAQSKQDAEPAVVISINESTDNKEAVKAAVDAARAAGQTVQVLSTEQYARQLERLGFYQEAEKIRGHLVEDSLTNKARGFMKTGITRGDVLTVGLTVGGVLLVWEVAARWLDIPAFGWFKKKEQNGQVRKLSSVGGSR